MERTLKITETAPGVFTVKRTEGEATHTTEGANGHDTLALTANYLARSAMPGTDKT